MSTILISVAESTLDLYKKNDAWCYCFLFNVTIFIDCITTT